MTLCLKDLDYRHKHAKHVVSLTPLLLLMNKLKREIRFTLQVMSLSVQEIIEKQTANAASIAPLHFCDEQDEA